MKTRHAHKHVQVNGIALHLLLLLDVISPPWRRGRRKRLTARRLILLIVMYNMFSVPYVVSFVASSECNASSPLWELLVPLSQVRLRPRCRSNLETAAASRRIVIMPHTGWAHAVDVGAYRLSHPEDCCAVHGIGRQLLALLQIACEHVLVTAAVRSPSHRMRCRAHQFATSATDQLPDMLLDAVCRRRVRATRRTRRSSPTTRTSPRDSLPSRRDVSLPSRSTASHARCASVTFYDRPNSRYHLGARRRT